MEFSRKLHTIKPGCSVVYIEGSQVGISKIILLLSLTIKERERAGCFVWFAFLVSCDCCVALPRDAIRLSAVCDCGIS